MNLRPLILAVAASVVLSGCGASSTGPASASGGSTPPAASASAAPQQPLVARPPAEAGDLVFVKVEDLAAKSTHVVRGNVTDVTAAFTQDKSAIVTHVAFDVTETLRGTPLSGSIHVTQLGGEVDGQAMSYGGRPVFVTGEELVLFLLQRSPENWIVVGLQQGKMEVQTHPETGEKVAVRSLVGVDHAVDVNGKLRALSEEEPAWLPLEDLRARVRGAGQ